MFGVQVALVAVTAACSVVSDTDPRRATRAARGDTALADAGRILDARREIDAARMPDAMRPNDVQSARDARPIGPDGGGPRDARPATDATRDAGGTCPGGCDDGVTCTRDECRAGACVSTPDDAVCGSSAGVCEERAVCDPARADDATGCVIGAARDCDDGIACTRDDCDERLGCTHAPNDSGCSDGRRCTTDRCDAAAGGCRSELVDADGDGAPAARMGSELCVGGTDCDDGNAMVSPSAMERCGNGRDDDCDGLFEETCVACLPEPTWCPLGWVYSNDGQHERCRVMFTPPDGVMAYCFYASMGYLGYSWPLGAAHTCPPGARYAPNSALGFCLWDNVAFPPGAEVDCTRVRQGSLEFRWPC